MVRGGHGPVSAPCRGRLVSVSVVVIVIGFWRQFEMPLTNTITTAITRKTRRGSVLVLCLTACQLVAACCLPKADQDHDYARAHDAPRWQRELFRHKGTPRPNLTLGFSGHGVCPGSRSRRRTCAAGRRAGLNAIVGIWLEGSASPGVHGQVWTVIPGKHRGPSLAVTYSHMGANEDRNAGGISQPK
jgi:hypothetical protein